MVSSSGQMRLMEVEIRRCFVLSQRETLHALSVGRKDIWLTIVHLEERRRNGKLEKKQLEKKQLEPRGIIGVIAGNSSERINVVEISILVIIKWIQRELIMEMWIWKNSKGLIGKCNIVCVCLWLHYKNRRSDS